MKLSDLEPELVCRIDDDNWRLLPHDAKVSEADGMMWLCPACFAKNGGPAGTHSLLSWFAGRNIPDSQKPGPGRWTATGDTVENITLRASILNDCWHGYITDGEVSTC